MAHHVGRGNLFYGVSLVGLGVDGAVICDSVDLLAFASNLSDCIFWHGLELLDQLIDDVDKDDL